MRQRRQRRKLVTITQQLTIPISHSNTHKRTHMPTKVQEQSLPQSPTAALQCILQILIRTVKARQSLELLATMPCT